MASPVVVLLPARAVSKRSCGYAVTASRTAAFVVAWLRPGLIYELASRNFFPCLYLSGAKNPVWAGYSLVAHRPLEKAVNLEEFPAASRRIVKDWPVLNLPPSHKLLSHPRTDRAGEPMGYGRHERREPATMRAIREANPACPDR